MPTFPTYHGPPLPDQLNPLDPRHWWMLITWVFFYPSRLKHYLYRADSELYTAKGGAEWSVGLHQPAYRSLALTGLLTTVSVPFGLWGVAALCGVDVDWSIVTFGVVVGVVVGLVSSVARGVAIGVMFSVMFGVAVGMAFDMVVGVAFGMVGGIVFGMASGVTVGIVFGVVSGMAVGVMRGAAAGVAGSMGVLIGSLQLVSWLIEMLGSQQNRPLCSELGVLPPPRGVMRHYRQQLVAESGRNLGTLYLLFQNSFRSHSALRLLNELLNQSHDPCSLFYRWLRDPQISEYIAAPLTSADFRRFPALRRVLLGNLGNIFVDRSGGRSERSERTAWQIARWLYRSAADHPLISLAQLLFELDQLADEDAAIDVHLTSALQKVNALEPLRALPYGEEIAITFALLAQAYKVDSTASIAKIQPSLATISLFPNPLRPEVIEILAALADIAQEIVTYTQASNPSTQGAALNRAVGLLAELAPQAKVIKLPEYSLIEVITKRWQALIAAEAGHIGDRALRELSAAARRNLVEGGERQSTLWQRPAFPFANPYITGRPVLPPLFVGRHDIMNQIAERWRTSYTPDSIILYGHRRMGKTSIVQNLGDHAPAGSMLVYLDLAGAIATAEQSGDLLLDLADKIHAAAVRRLPDLPQPQFSDYQQPKSADLHFQRLLRAVIDSLPDDAFLLLALDEFEALERAVTRGKLPTEVYGYLRMLSQQPRLLLVLAGLHTLDEMSRDYQQAFFSSYHNVRVSYLPLHEAERLIARPTLDFTLNYERSVIAAIYHQTYGQPLLIQSICSALVNHLNHELFDLEVKREARILPTDLDAILTDNFVQKESRYFEGIWRDQIADFPDQQRLLHVLARHPAPLTLAQLVTRSSLPVEAVNQALQALAKRDVVIEEGGQWRLLMPLFQRWLHLQESQNG